MKKLKLLGLLSFFTLLFITSCQVSADYQPVPWFTFDTIYVGETINFSNKTVDGGYYSWDFGDGNNSSDENPSHVYETAGTYDVTLTANSYNYQKSGYVIQTIEVSKKQVPLPPEGYWEGTDGLSPDYLYDSYVETWQDGDYYSISYLSYNFIETVWEETINEIYWLELDYNDDGTFDIPKQYYMKTLSGGGSYEYNIFGSGVWNNETGVLHIEYELEDVSDGFLYAEGYYNNGLSDYPYFIAELTFSSDQKNEFSNKTISKMPNINRKNHTSNPEKLIQHNRKKKKIKL